MRGKNLKISDFSNHQHLDFKNIDAHNTKFKENSFDYIIAAHVLHHITYPAKFFREMHKILKTDGIIVVVTFNSIEDKIVKFFFKSLSEKKSVSRYMPKLDERETLLKLISKKPIIPSHQEIKKNPPSRSAKLRFAVKKKSILKGCVFNVYKCILVTCIENFYKVTYFSRE